MPLYTPEELKKKRTSSVREIRIKDGDPVKNLWIPDNTFLYCRTHFQVKSNFKNARWDVIACFNQDPSEKGNGCPICEIVEMLWTKWKDAKAKQQKEVMKAIQDKINLIRASEYYHYNVIDIDLPEKVFAAIQFTHPMYKEIEKLDATVGISNVILGYKKSKNYSLTEQTRGVAEEIASLTEIHDELIKKPYEEGGPIDLLAAYEKTFTKEEYYDILGIGESKATVSLPVDLETVVPEIEVVEESISLDDDELMETPVEKVKPDVKAEKPKEVIAESIDDINLDDDLDSSLEELDLDEDLDLEPVVKMVVLEAKQINEQRKDIDFINMIYNFCLTQKFVTEQKTYKDKLVAIYNYAKNNKLEVPST